MVRELWTTLKWMVCVLCRVMVEGWCAYCLCPVRINWRTWRAWFCVNVLRIQRFCLCVVISWAYLCEMYLAHHHNQLDYTFIIYLVQSNYCVKRGRSTETSTRALHKQKQTMKRWPNALKKLTFFPCEHSQQHWPCFNFSLYICVRIRNKTKSFIYFKSNLLVHIIRLSPTTDRSK